MAVAPATAPGQPSAKQQQLVELPTASPVRVLEILTAARAEVTVQEEGWGHVWRRADAGPGRSNAFGDGFIAAGGSEAAVTSLRTYANSSAAVVEQVLHATCFLARVQVNAQAIVSAGGIEAVVDAMRAHVGTAGVQLKGCEALGHLSIDNSLNQQTIASVGGIEVVLSGMRAHVDAADVQASGCAVLGNLCVENPVNMQWIVSAGGIEAVVSGMRAHVDAADVQTNGCAALGKLSFLHELADTTFDVKQNHIKKTPQGEKCPETVQLKVGGTGLAIFDGQNPLESYAYPAIEAWASSSKTFDLTFKTVKSNAFELSSGGQKIRFGTTQGVEIADNVHQRSLSLAAKIKAVAKAEAEAKTSKMVTGKFPWNADTGASPTDLHFERGDVIEAVSDGPGEGWLTGTLAGKRGTFPANYVKERMQPLPQPSTVFDAVFSDEGPLGIRFVEAEATSQLDGEATTFLVIGEVRPGSYAARIAPQLREGLMLKAVNGTDVGDTSGLASERVYELLRQRPVSLSFIQLDLKLEEQTTGQTKIDADQRPPIEASDPRGDESWAITDDLSRATSDLVDEMLEDMAQSVDEMARAASPAKKTPPAPLSSADQERLLEEFSLLLYGARLAAMEPVFDWQMFRGRADGPLGGRQQLKFRKTDLERPLCKYDLHDADQRSVLERRAVAVFSSMLCYMGEKQHQYPSPELLAIQIMQAGIENEELRDEIYLQCMCQCTSNPDIWSAKRAWQLMSLLVDVFPPTVAFRPYVEVFLYRATSGPGNKGEGGKLSVEDEIICMAQKYSQTLLWKLDVRMKEGAVDAAPSEEEIQALQAVRPITIKVYFTDHSSKPSRSMRTLRFRTC